MATTIINPAPANNTSDNSGMGFLLGVIALIVFVVLFFIYAIPYIRGLTGSGGIQVNIPKNIDVKVEQSK